VADGSQIRLYVDGVLDASLTSGLVPATGTGNHRIGRRSHSTNTYYFSGLVDEVRVSDSAVYSAGFTPQTSLTSGANTKGLWKFNSQTAEDTADSGNNGTLQGGRLLS
jgi:hypothetical protein